MKANHKSPCVYRLWTLLSRSLLLKYKSPCVYRLWILGSKLLTLKYKSPCVYRLRTQLNPTHQVALVASVAEANSKVTTVTAETAACDKKGSQCSSHNFAIRVWFVLTWHSRKKSGIVC